MLNNFYLFTIFSLVACGRNHGSSTVDDKQNQGLNQVSIVTEMSYPANNQLEYNGQLLADLSITSDTVTSLGIFRPGRTLNVLTINGKDFLVYGEDGVSAAECEPHVDYPDHGPQHSLCETFGAESFDRIIVCAKSNESAEILYAQEWSGVTNFMTDTNKGLNCWINGLKMKSSKVFTY